MKKVLWALFLLWPFNLFAATVVDLGVRRNSTGTFYDSIYCYGVMSDSLALRGLKADSIRWYRYRGTTFVDSTKNLFGADSIPTNPLGSHWQKGVFRKAFRASNSGGEVGQYTVLAKVYIGSQSSANYEENYVWTYMVITDPPGDTDTSDVVTGEVRINSIDTVTQVLNEVRVVSTDTLTTLLGNVNGNVAGNVTGSVGSVLAEVRVNSIDTLAQILNEVRIVSAETTTTLLGNVNGNVAGSVGSVTGAVGSVTAEVRVNSIDTITQVLNEVRVVSTDTVAQVNNEVRVVSTDTLTQILNEVRIVSSETLRVVTATDTARNIAAAGIQAIRDSLRKLIFDTRFNLTRNGDFEMEDSTGTNQTPVHWRTVSGSPYLKGDNPAAPHGRYALNPDDAVMNSRDTLQLGTGHRLYLGAYIYVDTTAWALNPELSFGSTTGPDSWNLFEDGKLTKRHWTWVDTIVTVSTAGRFMWNVTGSALAQDTVLFDYITLLPIDVGDTAAIARAPWDNDLIAQTGRIVDSTAKAPRTHTLVDSTVGIARIGDAERSRVAQRTADSVWESLFADRDDVAGSFGDSAQGWGQTGAGAAAPDSAAINRFIKRAGWGIAQGSGSDSSTVGQRTATASLQNLGAGPYTLTIYTLDSAAGTAVEGFRLSIRDSATGTNYTQAVWTGASGYGQANTPGSETYYVRGAKANYRFAANADTVLNVAAANFTDTVLVVGGTIGVPSSGNLVRVTGYEKDASARGIPGLKVSATMVRPPGQDLIQYPNTDSSNQVFTFSVDAPLRSDTAGCWYIDLLPPSTLSDTTVHYVIKLEGHYMGKKVGRTYNCVRPPNTVSWLIKKTDCVQQ